MCVSKTQVSKKFYIAKYFLNSSKTLIISKNSDIWLFLPSNNGCTFLLLEKKKHKLLSKKVVCVVGVAFLLVEGIR